MKAYLLLICLALLAAEPLARAGTFTSAPWTNDASTGISAGQTVWARHLGATTPATVNGVSVAGQQGPAFSSAQYDLAGPNSIFTGDVNDLTAAAGAGSAVMAQSFVYNSLGASSTVTVKGLVSGENYVVSLFSVGWQASTSRPQTFSSGSDSASINQQAFGADAGIRVDYAFTATAATRAISVTPQSGLNTWHFYGIALKALPMEVTNTNDSGPGSLRQAVLNADAFAGADLITFAPALSGQTIALASQIVISSSMNIDASSLPDGLTLNGQNATRLLLVPGGVTCTLVGLALTNGRAPEASFSGDGGGIHNSGNLTVNRCSITGNGDGNSGGGIYNFPGASLAVNHCTFAANHGFGGGVHNAGTLTVNHCTLANNSSTGFGGGIFNNGALTLTNSIVAANGGGDILHQGSSLTRNGANIVPSFNSGTNVTGPAFLTADPLLAPLANYGGPTPTFALLPGSPARNAAVDSTATSDQRGFPIVGVRDIGAYEAQIGPIADGTVNEGVPVTLPFTVGSVGALTASSSNPSLLPDTAITLGGSGGARTIELMPAASRTGSVVVTIIDSLSGETQTFTITVISLTVTNTNDSGPGSLREAIADADLVPGANTITFDPALFAAGDVTITLTTFDTGTDSDEFGPSALRITSDVTIQGPGGGNGLTIQRSGGSPFRLFYIYNAATPAQAALRLENVTLSGGLARGFDGGFGGNVGGGGGGGAAGMGGAVFNRQGTLTLRGVTLSGNAAEGGNGGDRLVDGGGGGGGVGGVGVGVGGGPNGGGFGDDGGFGGGGGGLSTAGSGGGGGGGFGGGGGGSGVDGGFGGFGGGGGGGGVGGGGGFSGFGGGGGFDGGSGFGSLRGGGGGGAGMGGALFNHGGTVSILNSTLSANSVTGGARGGGGHEANGSGLGGAVFNLNGSLTVTRSTFSGNSVPGGQSIQGGRQIFSLGDATPGDGIGDGAPATGSDTTADVTLDFTLLGQADTLLTDFIAQTRNGGTSNTSGTGNLIRSNSGFSGGIVSTADPLLAPLGDYGGPTPTMALLPGSPARNAAVGSTATTDQRGFPIVGVPDIGAYDAGATTNNYNAWIYESLSAANSFPWNAPVPDAQHASTFDFDGDGQNNGAEFDFLTDPTSGGSSFSPTTAPSGTNLLISFPSATGRSYSLLRSDTLPGSFVSAGLSPIAGDGGVKTFTVPTSSLTRRFYQVQAGL